MKGGKARSRGWRTMRIRLDAVAMHPAVLPLPHVLAVRAPRVRAEAVDATVVDLANVLVANLPRVHAQAVHPPILPLTLKLVTRGKAVGAAAALEARLPVALVPTTVRVHAHTHTVHLAILHMPCVLAFHLRQTRTQGGWQAESATRSALRGARVRACARVARQRAVRRRLVAVRAHLGRARGRLPSPAVYVLAPQKTRRRGRRPRAGRDALLNTSSDLAWAASGLRPSREARRAARSPLTLGLREDC